VTVSEEEARTWFEENRGDAEKPDGLRPGFHEPEKARIRFAMLGAGDEALVRGLHAKLKSGERTFGDVAREHSLDAATKANGGETGWVSREILPDSLAAAVFSGENGLLEPVRGESAWYLVEVLERQAGRPLNYEDLRGEIIAHLEAQRTAQVVRIQMGKLRKVANLQIFPENL
jgi:parvulin-like peptidyl-prolyl isomerase